MQSIIVPLFFFFIIQYSNGQKPFVPSDSKLAKEVKYFFKIEYDEFSADHYTWYEPKSEPKNMTGGGGLFSCYFGVSNGAPNNFRLLARKHSSVAGLDLVEIKFLVDGELFTLTPAPEEIHSHVENRTFTEWADMYISGEEVKVLEAIKGAKKVKAQFVGKNYSSDTRLSGLEIDNMATTMQYYIRMGGQF